MTMVGAQFAGNTVSRQGWRRRRSIQRRWLIIQFLTNTVALTRARRVAAAAYAAGDITASGGLFQTNDCAGDSLPGRRSLRPAL